MDPDPLSISVIYSYILLIVVLLLGGAYFASSETAFASVKEIRLISMADKGNKRAKIALKIKEDFDSALTSILIGNNIMHISCSSVATLLASKLWGNSFVTITTFVTTFIVFIFAEMIPKAYASDCNEKLTLALAPSLYVIIKILTPLNIIFKTISKFVTELIGVDEGEDVTVSEEELFDIIENIDEEDEILSDEAELVKSALEMTVKTAKDIIIPIDKVVYIDENMDYDQINELIINGQYTRLPVFKQGKPIGILQIRKYLKNRINNKKNLIPKSCLDKIVYIKEDKPIDELLDYLSLNKTHMALVRDKNKKIIGILTMEDILEELVGEIYDEEEKESI